MQSLDERSNTSRRSLSVTPFRPARHGADYRAARQQSVTFALPRADGIYVLEHARIAREGDPARFAAAAGTGYL